eukprot:1159331-Pelagomonas_calceolata.AAC.10
MNEQTSVSKSDNGRLHRSPDYARDTCVLYANSTPRLTSAQKNGQWRSLPLECSYISCCGLTSFKHGVHFYIICTAPSILMPWNTQHSDSSSSHRAVSARTTSHLGICPPHDNIY